MDEGPASAAVSDPMATYGRLSAAGIRATGGLVGRLTGVDGPPTGGAGPVERRTATPEELAAARAREMEPVHLAVRRPAKPAMPAQRSWNGKSRRPAAAAPSRDQPVDNSVEKPVAKPGHKMTTEVPTEPIESMADSLAALADAVVEAIEAQDELLASEHLADQARLRWTAARAALDAAYRALDDPPPAIVESGADHSDPIPGPARKPTAEGGRATTEQLRQSRRNGQAAMQAQRRAVERTGSMPAYQRRMVEALLATGGDRAKAAERLGIKLDSLKGSLTPVRARNDLTEAERAVLSTDRRRKAAAS